MKSDESNIPVYAINMVSQMTGVPGSTLRFWENRFGLIQPMRTEGGHRLYSREDVERIRWLKQKIDDDGLRAREAHTLLAKRLVDEGEVAGEPAIRGAIMILVAEKDPITAELEEYFLREAGYDVMIVNDGRRAVAEAEANQPDVIIIDVILPGMSGLKVCQELKANPATRHIPVIIFSMLDVRDRALREGADAFLLKPIDQPKLVEAVKAMLVSRP